LQRGGVADEVLDFFVFVIFKPLDEFLIVESFLRAFLPPVIADQANESRKG
jgi:hypothetical protein